MAWIPSSPMLLRRSVFPLLCVLSAAVSACTSPTPEADETRDERLRASSGAEYLATEVVVRRPESVSEEEFRAEIEALGGYLEEDEGPLHELRYHRVTLPVDALADEAISDFLDDGIAETAERNYLVSFEAVPDDPDLEALWGMAKIQAEAAWDLHTGSDRVLVSVIDTGIDFEHGDLRDNLWKNPGEIPDNEIDDDGNGYVDDVYGYDWVSRDANPSDDHGHGTHVAGTIGARGDNGRGVVGVNWRAQIQGLKILSASGSGSLWSGAQAILYAAKSGAKVVNASWGCKGCNTSYVHDAIGELNKAGGLFVAAAGNARSNNDASPYYPASHDQPNVVAVAATDSADKLASFSNWGKSRVHLGAPGVGIRSTLPDNKYAAWSGTSMAAPHVAGAAALLLSHRGDMTPEAMRDKLMQSAEPIASLRDKTISGARLQLHALLTLDGDPPPAPENVGATVGGAGEVTISWTPPQDSEGEDVDDIAEYQVNIGVEPSAYAREEIVRGDLSFTFRQLPLGVKHYFAVRAKDNAGNLSEFSAEVSATPQDGVAPPQVIDLTAGPSDGGAIPAGRIVEASGEFSDFYLARNVLDGDPSSDWSPPPRAIPQEESLIVEYDAPHVVDRVELWPSQAYPTHFPVDFELEGSLDGTDWQALAGRYGVNAPTEPLSLQFTPTELRFLRLRAVRTYAHPSGQSYVALSELRARTLDEDAGNLQLRFTAPGDNPGEGAAASYDIRVSPSPLTENNFDGADAIEAPTPQAVPADEHIMVEGLGAETTYYFALTATDAAGNTSPMSNVASASTQLTPPGAITDLTIVDTAEGTLSLEWTAPGGDGAVGQASEYQMRYAAYPLHAGNFDTGVEAANMAPPASAGSLDSHDLSSLDPDALVYVAIRAYDEHGLPGPLSNVVSGQPQGGQDLTPPAQVNPCFAALSLSTYAVPGQVHSATGGLSQGNRALDGNPLSVWRAGSGDVTAPAELVIDTGDINLITSIRLSPSAFPVDVPHYPRDLRIDASVDGNSWSKVDDILGLEGQAGRWDSFPLAETFARYVRLTVTQRGPGDCGSTGQCTSADVVVSEVELSARDVDADVELHWVAPGDDGYVGTAVSYDVRRTQALPDDPAGWLNATPVEAPVPSPGGSLEVLRVGGLTQGSHFFALRAVDDAANEGPFCDPAMVYIPGAGPAPISDLVAGIQPGNEVKLDWTATGADGDTGTATRYEIRYSTAPIDGDNWDLAEVILDPPVPAPSGTAQSVRVGGLLSDTAYYFAMQAFDEGDQPSGLSNLASARTLDGTPPARVADLQVDALAPSAERPVTLSLVDSTPGHGQSGPDRALDDDPATLWLTAPDSATAERYLHVSLPAPEAVSRVTLTPSSDYADLFPTRIAVDVRDDANDTFRQVVLADVATPTTTPIDITLGAVMAGELRIRILGTHPWAGSHYAAIADVHAFGDPSQRLTATLSWTAPGDDGDQGLASSYDIRSASGAISDSNWSSASPFDHGLSPAPSGALERLVVPDLAWNSTRCFALQASDEQDNASGVSNSACATTPDAPPPGIADLAATLAGSDVATLTWTAPADDALASYEVRMGTERISDRNWDAATTVPAPSPGAPGQAETMQVSGLSPFTRYYFAVRAVDGSGLQAVVSNNAFIDTPDTLPPSTVLDLVASVVDPSEDAYGALSLTDSSGQYSPSTAPDYAFDGSFDTSWVSASGGEFDVHYLTATLPSPTRISGLLLRASDAYPDLFPVDFQLEVQTGGGAWQPVVNEAGMRQATGEQRWSLGSVLADKVRLTVTRSAAWSGAHFAALAELRVLVDNTDRSAVRIRWTAPGDDGDIGRAQSYDMRRHGVAMDAGNFADGASVLTAPPRLAGSLEYLAIAGLPPGTQQCFALTTTDDQGLASDVSNSPCVTLPALPPNPITDLSAVAVAGDTIDLSWTAPGSSEDQGTAAAYEVRMASSRIHDGNWDSATLITAPTPSPAGTTERTQVTGLDGLTTYYFAMRATNPSGGVSGMSNNAFTTTLDNAPPDAVLDLALVTDDSQWGAVVAQFTSPADNNATGGVASYDLRVSTAPIDAGNFGQATAVPVPDPAGVGVAESITIVGLAPERTYYAALRATDPTGNVSGLSNVAMASTRPEAPGGLGGLSVSSMTGDALDQGTATLVWTATGDDDTLGTASSYELRHSDQPIDASNLDQATLVTGLPTPSTSGTPEQFQVPGLPIDQTAFFALIAIDDLGQHGPMATTEGDIPDGVAPGAIADLTAVTGTGSGRIDLSWSAPGDSGDRGRATSYEIRYSDQPIDAGNWGAATQLSAVPNPSAPGQTDTAVALGLSAETAYHFAVRASDEQGLQAAMSNIATARTADEAPDAISDLQVVASALTSITVGWTASGDNGQHGQAHEHELRMATTPIDASNFAAATLLERAQPGTPGSAEQSVASGLSANTTYYFAVVTTDDRGNASGLSNVLSVSTDDNVAPGAVADLAAVTGPVTASVVLSWTAPGDDDQSGRATSYDVRASDQPINAGNFAAAAPVSAIPTPKDGGSAEQFTVTGLAGEQTHHFALRAIDDAGNVGTVSNAASASTLPIPPATVSDLAATGVAGGVSLSWTAPGDDGDQGQATSYELRFALTPISLTSWDSATPVPGAPAPGPAGTTEGATLTGTTESTTYYFAVRAIDDTGTPGALSNIAQVVTLDETAPGAPQSFSLSAPGDTGQALHGTTASASTDLGIQWVAGHALDGKSHTSWASAANLLHADQDITVVVSGSSGIDRVRMQADAFHPQLFPRAFTVQVGSQATGFTTVATETEFQAPNSGGAWFEWGFPTAQGTEVRVIATDTASSYGQYYAIVADIEAYEARPSLGRTRLTWLSPGDDDNAGRADHYEVYRGDVPFTESSLSSAVLVPNPPLPAVAGSVQSMEVFDLDGERDYHWAMRAVDDSGNVGPLTPVLAFQSNAVAPATTTDLVATAQSQTDVTLAWTAPGDDDTRGQANRYEIRYAPFAITSQNFALATELTAPTPAMAGQAEALSVGSLAAGTTYRFALIAFDEADNASYLSNVAVATTVAAPDTTPPGAVTDLQGALPDAAGLPVDITLREFESDQAPTFPADDAVDGDPGTMWVTAARNTDEVSYIHLDASRTLDTGVIRVWPSASVPDLFPRDFEIQVSPDGLKWTTIHTESGYVASAGVPVVANFQGETAAVIALHITGNAGGGASPYQSAVAEIELHTADDPAGTVYLGWTAPGDDGFVGTAAGYELSYSACPFNAAAATPLATSAPLEAGIAERYRLVGLPSGTTCFGLLSHDEGPRYSSPSNTVQLTIP